MTPPIPDDLDTSRPQRRPHGLDEAEEYALAILDQVDPASARLAQEAFERARDSRDLREVSHDMVEVTTKASAALIELATAMRGNNEFRKEVLAAVQTKGGLAALALVFGSVLIWSGFAADVLEILRLGMSLVPTAGPTQGVPG